MAEGRHRVRQVRQDRETRNWQQKGTNGKDVAGEGETVMQLEQKLETREIGKIIIQRAKERVTVDMAEAKCKVRVRKELGILMTQKVEQVRAVTGETCLPSVMEKKKMLRKHIVRPTIPATSH